MAKPPNTEPPVPEAVSKEDRLRAIECACNLYSGRGDPQKVARDVDVIKKAAGEFVQFVQGRK